MVRRQALVIDGDPHSARIIDAGPKGPLVVFCLRGHKVASGHFDAPMHVLADRVSDIVNAANQEERRDESDANT